MDVRSQKSRRASFFMTDKPGIYKRIKVAGALMFIPLVLGAGPLGGYILGKYLQDTFSLPRFILPTLVMLGTIGAISETVRVIRFLIKTEEKDG